MGDTSGSGVAFTRDPATGENSFYAEVLMNAQGEDVVAGVRTPLKIESIKENLPEIYEELIAIARKLENHYHDGHENCEQSGKCFFHFNSFLF